MQKRKSTSGSRLLIRDSGRNNQITGETAEIQKFCFSLLRYFERKIYTFFFPNGERSGGGQLDVTLDVWHTSELTVGETFTPQKKNFA